MRAVIGGLGALALAAAIQAPVARALDARHPHFDDRGTLSWTSDARAALASAFSQRRLVLVVSGRPDDDATRELVTRVLPDPQAADRLRALCVGLALDGRRPDPVIDPLFASMLGLSSTTPQVAFLGADGRWITGFRGPAGLPRFLQHLALAERALAQAAPAASGAPMRGDDAHLPPPVQRTVSRPASATLPRSLAAPAAQAPEEDQRLSSVVVRVPVSRDARPLEASTASAGAGSFLPSSAPATGSATASDASRTREARVGLDRALAQVLAGDHAGAVATLRGVKREAAGLPEAAEAERGIDAILTASDLGRLSDPTSVLASTLRRTKRDELRGTRWARLFTS